MSWNIDINSTNDIERYEIILEQNGLKFTAKISVNDIQQFIKSGQLLIKNRNHNMHLHIVTGRIDGIQYVDSDNKNNNNDFKLRFDGKYGSEILEYVKKFWENKMRENNEKEEKKFSNYTLEKILIEWCDENLTNNRSYGSNNTEEFNHNSDGELVYRDGTACSASSAFSYVYKLKDKIKEKNTGRKYSTCHMNSDLKYVKATKKQFDRRGRVGKFKGHRLFCQALM